MKYIEKTLIITLVISFLMQIVPVQVFAKEIKKVTDVIDVEKEAYIVEEIEEKREIDKKYFRMSDGSTMIAMYNTEIHNLEDGKYVDINNELIGITDLFNNNM